MSNDSEKNEGIPVRMIIPNLITSTAVCAGITSISLASEGRFSSAIWALFIACICDGIDGRIARLLNASSKMGAELDSLADFVNFGVAPAMFMFFWLTGGPMHVGFTQGSWVVRAVLCCSLFYALCDCFRLARFNTMLEQPTLPYWQPFFTGVPAPGGCWMVLTPAILYYSLEGIERFSALCEFLHQPAVGIFMLLFVGALMASRLPTISLKHLHIPKKFMPMVMAALMLLIAFLVTNFWVTLGVVGVLYIFSVPLTGIIFLKVRSKYVS